MEFLSFELDIFKYAKENSVIMNDVLEKIKQMTKKEILKNHCFNIWIASDGRFKTYLPDTIKSNGRRMIAKSTLEKLENEIVQYYFDLGTGGITLKKMYPDWLHYKGLHTNSTTSIHRIDNDWCRYYASDKIITIPITKFKKLQLEEWALNKIRDNSLTKKQYYNMSMIIRQILDFAVEKEIITQNVFRKFTINSKLFTRSRKKQDITQVYLIEEQEKIVKIALEEFYSNPQITTPLAICLNFQLGLRLGELVALKSTDIQGNYIRIERMEVRKEEIVNNKWVNVGYEVVEHTKSVAGERNIFLTSQAKEYIEKILNANKEYGYNDRDYLFQNKNGKIHSRAVDNRIRKYCKQLGIIEKSMHKIRKTYISTLIDSGLNINKIREFAGHESEITTYGNYCFSRLSDKQTEDLLEKVFQKKCNQDCNQK